MPSDKVIQALNLFEEWVEAAQDLSKSKAAFERFDAVKRSLSVLEDEDFYIALFAETRHEGNIEEVYKDPQFEGLTKPEIAAKIKQIFQTGASRIEEANDALAEQRESLDRTLSDIEADNIRRRQLEALQNWQPSPDQRAKPN
ncbi:MAG: hypothetical protein MRY79_07150 [Alphaproteobacteria bacterium]|nr:hypothetical protein [Alphaproteobacteria bacterium]